MLRLEQDWIWDSWPWDDEEGLHHLFFLRAPRSLGDPDLRHHNARIGHAVSRDYREWSLLPDALRPAPGPAWDDGATWTGSVVRGPSGRFHLFYTGVSRAEGYLVQRVGRADSIDGVTWTRFGDAPLVEVDARWYEIYDGANWHDQAWRDPWVYEDPTGDGWHMLITARAREGERDQRGVIGHAWSADLDRWEVRPPLSAPDQGFGQMEVMQRIVPGVGDAASALLFCCGTGQLSDARIAAGQQGGMWIAEGSSSVGPWDVAGARRLDHAQLYAAHAVVESDGTRSILGFAGANDEGFDGVLLDPVPVEALVR